MPRIVFTILGNRVQNVGYRLFLLKAMKERGIVGYPTNLGDGKQVSVVAWGNETVLNDFYLFTTTNAPKNSGKLDVSGKIIDSKPRPKPFDFLNEKMDLMIEQIGKTEKLLAEGYKKMTKLSLEIEDEMKHAGREAEVMLNDY